MKHVRTRLLLACALAAAPAPAVGQEVVGRVLAEETGTPLGGVFVTLTDGAGTRVAGALTRADGTFALRAQSPGEYGLAAELIGYRATRESVALGPGASEYRVLRLALQAIDLGGISARATRQRSCRIRRSVARELAEVWEVARQALDVASWTRESSRVRADGVGYQRVLDLVDHEVLAETGERFRSVNANLFRSLDPERIREDGFVLTDPDGGATYYGVDARLLLSDAFLETHCFTLTRRESEGLIGLAFEPVREGGRADVEGTLWLDTDTGHLRTLEYRYTRYGVNVPLPPSRFGGRTGFRHLPGGEVVVESWWLRMPKLMHWANPGALRSVRRCGMAACEDGETLRALAGAGLAIEEEGGEIRRFRLPDGSLLPAVDRASIAGVVFDSTGAGTPIPLAEAEVFLRGTQHRTVTDADGRFRLDNLPAGSYRVGFRHARQAELGIERTEEPVVAAEAGTVAVAALALPSRLTLARRACADRTAGEAPERLVFGVVRDAATGARIGDATVRLRAPRRARTPDGAAGEEDTDEGSDRVAEVVSDPAGGYVFCGVPRGPLSVEGEFLGKGTVRELAEWLDGEAARADLDLTLSRAGRILGRVVEAHTDSAVGGAIVRVVGAGLEAITNEHGRFVFDSVPAGAAEVEVEHVAFSPSRGAVALRGGETVELDLRVADRVFELEPLVVTARSRPLRQRERMGGFLIRQARGLGIFIGPEDLRGRGGANVTDLFRETGGIRVASSGLGPTLHGRAGVSLGGQTQNPHCSPQVYLDGTRISTRTASMEDLREIARILDAIPVSQVAGVEIYPGSASVPGEFAGLDTSCGVVAVWTRVSDHSER